MLLLLSSLLENLIFGERSKHCSNRPAIHAELQRIGDWAGFLARKVYDSARYLIPIGAHARDSRRADARLGRQ
jgi:hypothetical protein